MADDALERWLPEPGFARIPVQLGALAPTAILVVVTVAFFALATRSLFPLAIVVFALLAWLMLRGPTSRNRHLLTRGVCFELHADRVRVCMADARRDLLLTEIERISVVRASRRADVGHVVLYRRGATNEPPSIPTGRRVTGGSVGLVTWASVEHVDPVEQLHEGAMTFWFVARPEAVRDRVAAAVEGVSPHSRGPHR